MNAPTPSTMDHNEKREKIYGDNNLKRKTQLVRHQNEANKIYQQFKMSQILTVNKPLITIYFIYLYLF